MDSNTFNHKFNSVNLTNSLDLAETSNNVSEPLGTIPKNVTKSALESDNSNNKNIDEFGVKTTASSKSN